jgi:pyruvate dehydrogenase E2 component (dihydrolipoamide acetyltransferase)
VAVAGNVIMPSLGFDMTEGTLARWLIEEGDRVEKGQAIVEIETEKATVEIEAAVSGILSKIVVQAGQNVPVGTVIGIIAEPGEDAARAEAPVPPTAGKKGGGTTEGIRPTSPHPPATPAGGEARAEVGVPARKRVKASPVARRMAEEAGLDLARIEGTGPDGRVMERDVRDAIAAKTPPPRPDEAETPRSGGTVPLNRMRLAIARRMAESKKTAPHFYVTVEINMDEAANVREQLNRLASDPEKVTVTDLVVAAAARTLARFPDLNASYHDGNLVRHPTTNIGIATAMEGGLITPVLREADRKTLKAIAVESRALGGRARANKLRSDDLGSGTFTVSNLGMYDVDEFTAIINPPEAAILAVGAVTRRPVAVGDEVRIASVMKATLSVDHRVADGAQAALFLQEFKKLLENPVNLLTG